MNASDLSLSIDLQPIFAMDSTTIALVANCMPWAKHRRKKAAVKCHLSLNLGNRLPQVICVDEACHHDNRQARFLCNPMQDAEWWRRDMEMLLAAAGTVPEVERACLAALEHTLEPI